jgi:hypothetical protein
VGVANARRPAQPSDFEGEATWSELGRTGAARTIPAVRYSLSFLRLLLEHRRSSDVAEDQSKTREPVMKTVLLIAAAATIAGFATVSAPAQAMPIANVAPAAESIGNVADVRHRRSHRRHVHRHRHYSYYPYGYAYSYKDLAAQGRGPAFLRDRNRCIVDLGYGRWELCN